MVPVRHLLVALLLAASSAAFAGLGDPPGAIVAELSSYAPVATATGFSAADDFAFSFQSEDGVAVAVSGNGRLSDANVRFVGALLAEASGYGSDIAAPIADFFRTRAEDLNGAGPVPIQVVDYDLTATVTGETPGLLEFVFQPRRVAPALFPEAAHAIGAEDADYVVRVFSDFQCPFCANFAGNVLPTLREELLVRDDVRLELHHFPLRGIHPNANVAAEASECVAAEGGEDAFWTFHDALFEQRQRWADVADPVETFVVMAKELGLPSEDLATCLRSGVYSDVVDAAYRAAAEGLLLTGTPTVFLNGLKVGDYGSVENYLRLMRLSDALAEVEPAEVEPAPDEPAGDEPAGDEPAGDEPAGDGSEGATQENSAP